MTAAVLISFALLLGAVATAMGLGWRRWASQPVPVAREVEGPTCYPKVRR